MQNSTFQERCFGTVLLLALLALFTATAFALIENEPRVTRSSLLLYSPR